jgi:hypothetical protein
MAEKNKKQKSAHGSEGLALDRDFSHFKFMLSYFWMDVFVFLHVQYR